MRRRQINAMKAQEVAVTITERGAFIPVGRAHDPAPVERAHGECPRCGRVLKGRGAHFHVKHCKGNV